MEKTFLKNPFLVGGEVCDERFIGRRRPMERLHALMQDNQKCNSISLCGLPRIGKSSLVYQAFQDRDLLESRRILYVRVSMGDYHDYFEFWTDVLCQLQEQTALYGIEHPLLAAKFAPFLENRTVPYIALRTSVSTIFRTLARLEYKTILCIDEFDAALHVFGNDPAYYQLLRTTATAGDTNLSVVLISRRSLSYIESHAYGGSTLSDAFSKMYLRGFDEEDIEEYFCRFEQAQCGISPTTRERIEYYGGRSPFLLSAIGSLVVENPEEPVDDLYLNHCQQFLDYYENLNSLLKEEGNFNTMVKVFVGPKYDLNEYDVQNLFAMGYLDSMTPPRSICLHYEEFLRVEAVDVDIWHSVSDTERLLRLMVEKEMERLYGKAWEKELEKRHGSTRFLDFEKAQRFREINRHRFGRRVEMVDSLLNEVGIDELNNIIRYYWVECFSKYFGGDTKESWCARIAHLAVVRCPLAHSTPEYLTEEDIAAAEQYCREISDSIRQVME